MHTIKFTVKGAVFLFLILFSSIAKSASDSLLVILQEELDREMKVLSKEEEPPYFMSFRIDDIQVMELSANFGSLISKNNNKHRVFTPQIRIGDYEFDNTHVFNDDMGYAYYPGSTGFASLPFDNDEKAIKYSIWKAVDESYKSSLQAYTSMKNRMSEEKNDSVADFAKVKPAVYFEPEYSPKEIYVDKDLMIQKIKQYSKRFREDESILSGQVSLRYQINRKYYLTTEGSSIVQNRMLTQLQVMAVVRNKEGHAIPQHFSLVAEHPNDVLVDSIVNGKIDDMMQLLTALKGAKPAEAYAGPAILSAAAAGVFFHEIFGHRVEGHRLEKAYDGQTFTDKVGEKVLPKEFSVVCDPTKVEFKDKRLIGSYVYDDEGVLAQKVELVNKGQLQAFLMSRQPTSEFPEPNGHSRAQPGNMPVSRQSNLLVSASKTYSDKDLRKKLISECKKQNKEYGYFFKSVIGGFTVTDRFNPNVFNIMPSEVYRVYTDGRPDELVVGVELIGTPLTMFSNIVSAGDEQGIFSGFCGAESGFVPVTAIAPALFVRKVETQKGMEIKTEVPLLPSPTISEN